MKRNKDIEKLSEIKANLFFLWSEPDPIFTDIFITYLRRVDEEIFSFNFATLCYIVR
jgi:hypothetical protein